MSDLLITFLQNILPNCFICQSFVLYLHYNHKNKNKMTKQTNTIKEVVFNYQIGHADGTLSSAQKITREGVISVQQPRMTYKHGFFNIECTIQNGMETVDYSVIIDGRRITCNGIINEGHYAEFIIEHDNSLTPYDYNYDDLTFQIDYLIDALEDYLQNC